MMKLSGWKRLGIVASVVWAIGGYFFTFQDVFGSSQGLYDTIKQDCLQRANNSGLESASSKCEDEFTQSLHESMVSAREAGIFAALVPIPLVWGGLYFGMFLFRWVRRGFPAALAPATPTDGSADIPPPVKQHLGRTQMLAGGGVAVLVVWLIYSRIEANHVIAEDRHTIADLTAKQKALDDKPSFELQARCSEAAKQYFHREFEEGPAVKGMDADYTSHYNPDLRKCFIAVKTDQPNANGTIFTTHNVYDAVEGGTIGEYVWQSDKVKKYWEVPPIMCHVQTPDGDDVQCKNDGEYSNLMSKFMDITID